MDRIWSLVLLAPLAACASPAVKTLSDRERLAQLEDARQFDESAFRRWVAGGDPQLASRAALALGRIADPGSIPLLLECARNGDTDIAQEALFALGQIARRDASALLLARCSDKSPTIRALALEALGKIADVEAAAQFLHGLNDAESTVRAQAALAISRSRASGCIQALGDTLAKEQDAQARWKMSYSLASLADPASRPHLLALLKDPEPLCRNFAAWGLDKLPPQPEDDVPLQKAANDPDDAVASRAALALGKRTSAETLSALAAALQRESFHVRRAAIEALGNMPASEKARSLLAAAWEDPSLTVRAEALLSLVKLDRAQALPWLQKGLKHEHFLVRGKCAAACTLLSWEQAQPFLEALVHDTDVRVASAAAAALREFSVDGARTIALQALQRDDLSVRGEAADTLAAIGDRRAIPALQDAFRSCAGHEMDEAREKISAALRKLGGIEASKDYAWSFASPSSAGWIARQDVPLQKNPCLVEIETDRGTLTIELDVQQAPKHVENFLALARAGHFDSTVFHRVVSNWVVQGGDHRGDGWGATSVQGGYLRDEIGRGEFVRGSLGMPKSDHRDSGGCQIFITLLPTPRLDGRYTKFGQVVGGLELLDRFEIGDRIRRVSIKKD